MARDKFIAIADLYLIFRKRERRREKDRERERKRVKKQR